MREERFKHEKRVLTVRAQIATNEVNVRVYEGAKPVTALTYSVTVDSVIDASFSAIPFGLVEELIDLAKDDVISGRVPLLRPP